MTRRTAVGDSDGSVPTSSRICYSDGHQSEHSVGRGPTACLEGLIRTDGHGRRLFLLGGDTVYWRGHRSSPAPGGCGRVKVLAGHRGGHFPAFARYVGAGMLDAVIAGPDRCRQPSIARIVDAVLELDDGLGVLILVANETSARLNYGIAAEKARTRGVNVKLLTVGDDVIRRRGTAGLVLLCKFAGSLSARGHTLAKIFAVCRQLSLDSMASVNAIIVKEQLENDYDKQDAVEREDDGGGVLLLGTDINGRNAVRTVCTVNMAETVSAVVGLLIAGGGNPDIDHSHRYRGAEIVAMVNNLGGMSDARFLAIAAEVASQLGEATGARAVRRWYAGRMLPSAIGTGHGFSVTIMDVSGRSDGETTDGRVYAGVGPLTACLDQQALVSGWPFTGCDPGGADQISAHEYVPRRHCGGPLPDDDDDDLPPGPILPEDRVPFVKHVIDRACDRIAQAEGLLNTMAYGDDDDCGGDWRRGARALQAAVAEGRVNASSPADTMRAAGRLLETTCMTGALGPLLSVFFRSAALAFNEYPEQQPVVPAMWIRSVGKGVTAVKAYGMFRAGDRSILDALVPALRGMEIMIRESKNPIHLLSRAVREADAAINKCTGGGGGGGGTARPDGGAYGVKIVLETVLEAYVQRLAPKRRKAELPW